ncbi:hypothetical protein [uncultured Polaribacter sp.]|uniref:hypothetical protein n=1 Tax=uncultured Polaribacter sp. TaxID=174711 RepID=UPI00262EA543|nr:hypothetical protein [uncultured Polaribacter sp.]
MKKIVIFLALVFTITTFAQAPQGFNYQATVRNSSGELIINTNVYFKFNVIQGSQTAVPIFTETHYVPTDDLGQVNLVIGQGTATTGAFSDLDWSLGNYYLGIELNTGSGYVAMGTTQLLSVPYALYAANSGNGIATTPTLESVLAESNSANNQQIKNVADPTDAQDVVTKAYIEDNFGSLTVNSINDLFPEGLALGDFISWVWDGNIWEPIFSQLNDDVLTLVSDSGTDTQIVCEFESIQTIQYAINVNTTEIAVTGLPSGIGHTLVNGILTISGEANQDVSTQTTFNYTVTVPTQDTNVNTIASGTLIVAPKSSLVLDEGELNQTSCLGEPITPIAFVIEGKSPNATVVGLPEGVSANVVENKIIISGTPPISLASGSRFDFTVQTNSSACAPDAKTGSITVIDCSTCYPTAVAGADFSVCAGNSYTLQNASAANFTSLAWTTSGTGTFNDATTTSPTYVASNADVASGSVTLTLSTTNTDCTEPQTVVDTMVLTLTQCNSIDVTLQNNDELELFGNAMTYGAKVVTENIQNISLVGVCYSTSVAPTIDDANIIENNSGTDWWASATPSFLLNATGLSPNTTYYVRAFAKTINDNVVYGDQVEVSYTDPNIAEVYNFTSTSYESGSSTFSKITRLHLKSENFRRLNLTENTVNSNNIKSVYVYMHVNNSNQLNISASRQIGLNSIHIYGGNNNRLDINCDSNSALKTIFSPDIKLLNTNIYNNQNLESFTTTNVQEIDYLNIRDSESLTELSFPNVTLGNFIRLSLENLSSLDFASLESINRLTITENSITNLKFPSLKTINQLYIRSGDNESLTKIDFPELEMVGNGNLGSNSSFEIESNKSLTTLNIPSLTKIFGQLSIRNNRLLDVSSINNCNLFVYSNNGYKCNFGTVRIDNNANNNYCFQDSTKIQVPTITTTQAIAVTQTTATTGGSIVSPQGSIMQRKGVCWSTSQNPTVTDAFSDNGYGNDTFDAYVFGLLANTTYYYRAYAEDCNGIYYGNEMSFTTPQ